MALLGNPNVGKSTLFNAMTGLGVSTAHYPGTTREVQFAETAFGDRRFTVADLPGAYSLYTDTEESWVSRRALLDVRPDVVVVVVDAGNLARNLKLVLEVLDLGEPCVVAVNLVDEAQRAGIGVDVGLLSTRLGIRVVQTAATQGLGLEELVAAALEVSEGIGSPAPLYSQTVESSIRLLAPTARRLEECPYGLTPRALVLQLLSGAEDFGVFFNESSEGSPLLDLTEVARRRVAACRQYWLLAPFRTGGSD
ncbi:MAG: FeoB small GTPase domain-containing protein [Coriobacteriia bacterium]|nr:FeoB small GTPase domain-containing protein [Coriobacteriia bacterium]